MEQTIEYPKDRQYLIKMIKKKSVEDLHNSFLMYHHKIKQAKDEIAKVIKGQDMLIDTVLRAIIAKGHVLLEGLPGLGKTVLCRTLSNICELDFKRVQFTTDLLPSDIVGVMTYEKELGFQVIKGPIFTNMMLADEINRAPPKVQSALLEAMGEHQVTLGKTTYELSRPFLVMATQNPIEQSGTFPLPEAQLDRFLFKVVVGYPDIASEFHIMSRNLNTMKLSRFELGKVITKEDIIIMQELIQLIHVEDRIKHYILKLVDATRNPEKYKLEKGEYIEVGASPRASINILLAARAQALMAGRYFVIPHDVREVVYEVLRHRIILNFRSKMANIDTDMVIGEIIGKINVYEK